MRSRRARAKAVSFAPWRPIHTFLKFFPSSASHRRHKFLTKEIIRQLSEVYSTTKKVSLALEDEGLQTFSDDSDQVPL